MRMTPRTLARASCFTLLTLFSLVTAGTAWARDGRVNFVSGEARVERGGKTELLSKNGLIQSGDTIITGDTGRVQLHMADDAVIAIAPNSRFKIDEYRAPTSSDGGKSLYSLLEGGMGFISGLIGKKDRAAFAVRTPVATMGIRGSKGFLRVCNSDCQTKSGTTTKDGVYLMTVNGNLSLSNREGSVDVRPNEVARAASPPALIPPTDLGFTMMVEFAADLTPELNLTFESEVIFEPEIINSPN